MDTFIEDEVVWQELRNMTEEVFRIRRTTDKIHQRVERVKLFVDHIERRYSVLSDEAARRGLAAEWLGNPISDAKSSLSTNLDRIVQSAARNYGEQPSVSASDINPSSIQS